MKRKVIIITSLAIVFILAVCAVSIKAVVDSSKYVEIKSSELIDLDKSDLVENDRNLFKRDAAPKTRVAVLYDGTEVEVTYNESDKDRDYYIDADEKTFVYTFEGKLTGYGILIDFLHETDPHLSQSELEKIAITAAKGFLKEDYDGYVLDNLSPGTTSSEGVLNYYAFFSKHYGENGFVKGEQFTVGLMPNGKVNSCIMSAYGSLDDFDPDSLNGITLNDAKNAVKERLINDYGDSVESFELEQISISNMKGDYYLNICVAVEFSKGHSMGKVYCHKLS